MPKIYLVGSNRENKQGGGWTFGENLRKCFVDQLVDDPEDCDIFFISGLSMLNKLSEIPLDKKIVLRVDNILKRSCNRDIYPFQGDKVTMMEAMKLVAQKADLVVYQSQWAKDLLDGFLRPNKSTVIMNSADETIFNTSGGTIPTDKDVYFYSRSSNHDNKQWHLAYYTFIDIFKKNKNAELWIAGRFSPENIPNCFDFYNGEAVKYLGFITDPEEMAFYMRSAKYFLHSYFADCCSNTVLEAILSGTEIIWLEQSGGAREIKEKFEKEGREYFYLERMKQEYKKCLEKL